MDKIKKYAPVSEGSPVNVLSLIDSVNYQKNKGIKIVIRNPNVYYAFIVGQIKSEFASTAFLDIVNALGGKTEIKLNNITDGILPKCSNIFLETGFPKRFLFNVRADEAGEPQLFVQATKPEGGVEEQKVPKSGRNYNATGLYFPSIVYGKATKKYYVDISAHLSDDGKSIIIDRGEIRYPEWVFNAIPKKKL